MNTVDVEFAGTPDRTTESSKLVGQLECATVNWTSFIGKGDGWTSRYR